MTTMPREELERRISALGPWFHNIELDGVQTAPDHSLGNYPAFKWERIKNAIPQDLSGLSVLDIGCNAGFHSIEMKRRGAARVLGIDSSPVYLAQAQLAAQIHQAPIEFRQMDVYDVAQLQERFDVVLFMGVLYHLRHPLLALDLLYQHVVKDLLVFQTLMRGNRRELQLDPDYPFQEEEIFEQPGFPVLHFVENRYAGDPTNWWIPNEACARAMLRSAGFRIIAHPEEEVFLCGRSDG